MLMWKPDRPTNPRSNREHILRGALEIQNDKIIRFWGQHASPLGLAGKQGVRDHVQRGTQFFWLAINSQVFDDVLRRKEEIEYATP